MIVTLTGPSCAGKSTLERKLKKQGFLAAVSTTTRLMREGEINGEAYYFVTPQAFEAGVQAGSFVEHVQFGGNRYGLETTELNRLLDMGKPVVIVCEPVGQKQVSNWCRANGVKLVSVYIDGEPKTVAARFLSRVADEFQKCSDDTIQRKVDVYTARLTEMMTTERLWSEEAFNDYVDLQAIYSMYVHQFGSENEAEVIRQIVDQFQLNQEVL